MTLDSRLSKYKIHWTVCKLTILIVLTSPAVVTAADLFTITGTVVTNGVSETEERGFNDAKSAIEILNDDQLEELFKDHYEDASQVDVTIDFRGVPLEAFYEENGTDLLFEVEQLGIEKTFTGADRDESSKKFKDFMIENGDGIRDRLSKELVAESPVDPLAGNPISLMGQTVENTFAIAADRSKTAEQSTLGFSFRSGRYALGGHNATFLSLPLVYARDLGQTNKHRVLFMIPLTYSVVKGARSFSTGINANWQYRATENWTITPGVQYGIAGSYHLAQLGQTISGSLSSAYTWELGEKYKDINLTLVNSGTYVESLPLTVAGRSFNTNLSNYVVRNGIIADMPVRVDALNTDIKVRAYFNDTHFFGSKLFAEQYNEIGAGISPITKNKRLANLALNGSYIFSAAGDKVEGFNFRFHYYW